MKRDLYESLAYINRHRHLCAYIKGPVVTVMENVLFYFPTSIVNSFNPPYWLDTAKCRVDSNCLSAQEIGSAVG